MHSASSWRSSITGDRLLRRRFVASMKVPASVTSRWWLWWALAGSAAVIAYLLLPTGTLAHSLHYDLIAVTSVVAVVTGTRINRPARPAMWYLLAAGQTLWAAGDFTYGIITITLNRDQFPGLSDAFYLCAYPMLAASLFVLIRGRTSGRDRAGLLDASIIATGLALLGWCFMIRPLVEETSTSLPAWLISLAYPVGDVLLVVMAARLFTAPGARTPSYWLLIGALLMILGSDVPYAVITTVGHYQSGLIDVGWLLGYVAWGTAALHPSMCQLSETAPDQAIRITRTRMALLTATSLLPPLILIEQGLTDPTRIEWQAISISAVVLYLLVMARMSGLMAHVQGQAEQLDALAHNDALTGVPNRRAWDLELARRMADCRRTRTQVVVGLIDLDNFKRFNDQYGHQAGDRLLKAASAAWRSQLRESDLLARYGGEEFGLFLAGIPATTAASLVGRLQAATPLGQTFSAGLACWTGDESPERLIARADEALYQAKHTGRNRVMVHNGRTVDNPTLDLTSQAALLG